MAEAEGLEPPTPLLEHLISSQAEYHYRTLPNVMVPRPGVEPGRPKARAFKALTAANFVTGALRYTTNLPTCQTWCGRGDLNSHGYYPTASETVTAANFVTPAFFFLE